uniref:Uncharacterized protein n=1 Tax=Amphiprion percula TaxID=161767 RepID=A0A3P8RME3_AMPPE
MEAKGTRTQLDFQEDVKLSEMMRLRVSALQRSGSEAVRTGERLLLPQQRPIYRLGLFPSQELSFGRWVLLAVGSRPGHLSPGIPKHWSPRPDTLMTRPAAGTHRDVLGGTPATRTTHRIKCLEGPTCEEFGERIAKLSQGSEGHVLILVGLKGWSRGQEPEAALIEFTS